jgi:hypothetical protein
MNKNKQKTAVSRKPTYKTKEDFLRWYQKRAELIPNPAAKPDNPPAPPAAADAARQEGGPPDPQSGRRITDEQGTRQ